MRLDTVEIAGFKSFCDKQQVSFKSGVTGIVGPNGCGKSNISDAISWALGEQSAKSLRGQAMQDVIFAGSQARKPLAMAEVSLKVSGLNGKSPDGGGACVITRRLYRNGDSEYLMNGRICRLRDIHEIFMDTGLGSKAYSIIEQGKVGMILSSKPTDRRALIEEAAGITKYRARRRQTSLKLEAAQQNLLRVNDIVHEVEKQLEGMKRQASKARRYVIVRDELTGVERVLFGLRFLQLDARGEELRGRLDQERSRERAGSVVVDTEEAQLEAHRTRLYSDEERLQKLRDRTGELALEVDRRQNRSTYCREQLDTTEGRAEGADAEAIELQARIEPLGESLVGRRAEEQQLKLSRERADNEVTEAEKAVRETVATQRATEVDIETARDRQLALIGQITSLQNSRATTETLGERAATEIRKLGTEQAELDRDRGENRERLESVRSKEREARERRDSVSRDRAAAEARRLEGEERRTDLTGRADRRRRERDGIAGRLESLEEIVATHAAFDEGVRQLLDGPEGMEVLGVVADCVETSSQYEAAVESFLGDRLQAVITSDTANAVTGIKALRIADSGRGTLLPLDRLPARDAHLMRQVAEECGAVGLLSDLYQVNDAHAPGVAAALPDAIVVETLDRAVELHRRYPPIPWVTLDGDVLKGATIEGGHANRDLLSPRREIKEIRTRLEELESELQTLQEQADEARRQIDEAAGEARRHEETLHSVEKTLVSLGHDLEAGEEEARRFEQKAEVLHTERSVAERELDEAGRVLVEITATLTTTTEDRAAGDQRLEALAVGLVRARAESDTSQRRLADARSQQATLTERVTAAHVECERLAEAHAELQGRIELARSRGLEQRDRHSQLRAELQGNEEELATSLAERDRVTSDVSIVQQGVQRARGDLEAREQAIKERRRERDTLKEAVSQLEVERARVDADLDHLGRDCREVVGCTPQEAAAALDEEQRPRPVEELEQERERLQDHIKRMGPVNVLAVEQSEELSERFTFLTAQREDLVASIKDLEGSIRRIDKTSKERFKEAFAAIDERFSKVFTQLFGGGTAGLRMLDEQDVLESGIDILAQPPGKRLQNVMLLSGGEKALTAIGLLLAIFQYKPSPFCILDEVDAPLDDANIGRFVKLLETMKEETQFVLITHSKKTMEIADQLYGVTMEEPGVSKLVSVQFN